MLTKHFPGATFFTPIFLIQEILFNSSLLTHPVSFAILMVIGIIYHAAFVVVLQNVSPEARKLYPEAFKTAS